MSSCNRAGYLAGSFLFAASVLSAGAVEASTDPGRSMDLPTSLSYSFACDGTTRAIPVCEKGRFAVRLVTCHGPGESKTDLLYNSSEIQYMQFDYMINGATPSEMTALSNAGHYFST